jgi:Protein of unknown function (DUF2877)
VAGANAAEGRDPDMQLTAVSADSLAPRGDFDASVHSVFARVCNLALAEGMLSLSFDRRGVAPRGVRIAAPSGFRFTGYLAPGMTVRCRAGILDIGGRLAVDLGAAPAHDATMPMVWRDAPGVAGHAAWRAGWDVLCGGAAPDRLALAAPRTQARTLLEQLLARRLAAALGALLRATRRRDHAPARDAASRLIGLGPGLTPVGDDLLVGYLAGLHGACPRGDAAAAALVAALCATLRQAGARTSDLSRGFLDSAAAGCVSQPLRALALAIAAQDAPATRAATGVLMSVGASSGRNGALGLLLGLSVWHLGAFPRAAARAR